MANYRNIRTVRTLKIEACEWHVMIVDIGDNAVVTMCIEKLRRKKSTVDFNRKMLFRQFHIYSKV